MEFNTQLKNDKKLLQHPYDSSIKPMDTFLIKEAEREFLYLYDNTSLIDGMSSWWSVIHGYNNTFINNALKKQIDKMSHVMFGGLTHEPAINLGVNLNNILSGHFDRFFYCDSGSVAVEVAAKMAFQYYMGKGINNKNKILSFESAYHGDTFMAMSLCDPVNSMHKDFGDILHTNIFSPKPKSGFFEGYRDDHFDTACLLEKYAKNIAAVIIEPIVQGAGGMWFYHPEFLNKLKNMCAYYDILLIFDEIATGFGRTGKMFAFEYSDITPDIICLGKAITGGYMSFAAVGTTRNIMDIICNSNGVGAFMHGPTFMANPLACECANASINLLKKTDLTKTLLGIQKIISDYFAEAAEFPFVKDVRVLGGIGVIETFNNVNVKSLTKKFVQKGVWIRPFKNLIYIMPPYIISEESLKKLCKAVLEGLWEEFSKK
ncbi:adenosylmethionine--8-amino-7-oxononanoate transaminase [Flexistipes sinusarabici]|nr:adenosylmethionine--8-amino-7-oxononanoate transaminase [Flexistipes sinusarabici]